MSRVLLSAPDVSDAEAAALAGAFASGWVAPVGPDLDAFEAELAAVAGRTHAVALSSGTAALHLALLGLGLGPGDAVLTSSMTFAATANAVTYTGATPVFVDAADDGNLAPALVAGAAERARAAGLRVAALLPVDLFGRACDHAALAEVAAGLGVDVIHDAAESLGTTVGGRSTLAQGRAAAVSFNGNKIITTSGGGALVTDDAAFAAAARKRATQAREPERHYEHTEIGFNYRLSNLLAGLGRAQLRRLDEFVARRRAHRTAYRTALASEQVRLLSPTAADDATENCWLTSIELTPAARCGRDELIDALEAADVEARPVWKPMHLQPVFASGLAELDGTSERIFARGVSLPSGSAMTDTERSRVIDVVAATAGVR